MSTLYTNLPLVNSTPDQMRNDLNMISNIKIKLLRAGLFSLDSLSRITVGGKYTLKGIDIEVDRAIHIISNSTDHNLIQEFREISAIWKQYISTALALCGNILSPMEMMFVRNRMNLLGDHPIFASLETYAPGEYMIRV